MDYNKILRDFRQHYANLEKAAVPGSMEKHVYAQIYLLIDEPSPHDPPSSHAIAIQSRLKELLDAIDPPQGRPLVQEALNKLNQETQLPPL